MFVFRSLIILFVPVLWLMTVGLINRNDFFLLPATSVFLLFLFFAIYVACKNKFSKAFWHFLILPIVFSLASIASLLFITDQWAFRLIALISALILYFLVRQYYLYFNFPFKYQPYSLESLTFYSSLLALYFIFSSGFASVILLNLSAWLIMLVIWPIIGLTVFQFFWIHKINIHKSWLLLSVVLLIVAELFLAVTYLPTNYYVNAFILTASMYVMLGLGRLMSQGRLKKKKILSYIIVAASLALIVLATAKWS